MSFRACTCSQERFAGFNHWLSMDPSKLQRAARMRMIAAEFRDFAAQTEWPAYRTKMLEMAAELDLEAAKLEEYRRSATAS